METRPNQQDQSQQEDARQTTGEEQNADAAPRKQHGDALREGNGTRHGVEDAQSRPKT